MAEKECCIRFSTEPMAPVVETVPSRAFNSFLEASTSAVKLPTQACASAFRAGTGSGSLQVKEKASRILLAPQVSLELLAQGIIFFGHAMAADFAGTVAEQKQATENSTPA